MNLSHGFKKQAVKKNAFLKCDQEEIADRQSKQVYCEFYAVFTKTHTHTRDLPATRAKKEKNF